MGGSAPAAPNYQPLADASKQQAEYMRQIAQEQMQWAKDQYADNKPYADRVKAGMLDMLDFNTDTAKRDRARYEDLYQPVEDKQIETAMEWDSPERKSRQAGMAGARVGAAYDAADAEATRQLESFGIDPSAVRYGALNRGSKLARAAAQSGAMTKSDSDIDTQAVALRGDVINTGKGYPASIGGQFGTAAGAGTAGVNAGNSTTQTAAGSLGNPLGWSNGSTGALANWGNVLNAGYQAQLGQFNANQNSSQGWGQLLGTGVGLATAFLEDGGDINEAVDLTSGGNYINPEASPSMGTAVDDVPAELPNGGKAMLNVDEFIMPDYATRFYGTKYFQGLIDKAAVELGMPPKEAKPKASKPIDKRISGSDTAVPMYA